MDIHEIRRQRLRQLLDERYEGVQARLDERYEGVQARLAEAIKRPANYIWRLLSDGVHRKNVGEDLARLIEEKSGVNRYWLDEPAQGLHVSHGDIDPHQPPVNNVVSATGAQREVPLYRWEDLRVVGGSLTFARRPFAVVYADEALGEKSFCLAVKGMDMHPDFVEGERIVFDPELSPRAGDMVLASVNDVILFRRFRPRSDSADTAELLALNPDYAPIWSDRANVKILAVMVEYHRSRRARSPS